MNQATMISYITLAFIVLLVTSFEDAVAESTRQCLAEVREVMVREGIKQLGAGDQKRVNENCKQGDLNSATKYVKRIGAYKRCTQYLNDHIKNNNLDVDTKTLNRARGICRRGDLQKAIEVVAAGAPTKKPAIEPPEIISFVASSSNIKKGGAVTLSWRTANANTVMLSGYGGKDIRRVKTSGSQSVKPDKTTTYVLMAGQQAKGPTAMEEKLLKVTVSTSPTGPGVRKCSITGKLTEKWKQRVKEHPKDRGSMWTVDVAIFAAGSNKYVDTASVKSMGSHGIYRFNGLNAGEKYTVKPSWASSPPSHNVTCLVGKSHKKRLYNFKITGSPMID